MSKIGSNPVLIEPEVNVTLNAGEALIKGPKGEAKLLIPHFLRTEIKENKVYFQNRNADKKSRAMHGLIRTLVSNYVKGVKEPWEKRLEIHGVGFRVKLEGSTLVFQLGFSHPVKLEVPSDVSVTVTGNKITVLGVNKQRVGEVAAEIKRIRKPDKYKGKGIRYQGEVLRLKPGKKAKTTA